MITIYDIGNEAFTKNGDAVLEPTSAKVTQKAGSNYDLSLSHPIDPDGKWQHLVPGAVIRCPVPEETIESAVTGYNADVYRTTGEAALREGTSEPQAITNYSEWNYQTPYQVGSKVKCSDWTHHNYKCTYYDGGSGYIMVPPYNSTWWVEIPDYTSGSAVLATLPEGTEVYLIEDVGGGWYKVSTFYGLIGYIKSSSLEFVRHMSEEDTKPRRITEQLFRITNAAVDTKGHAVNVTAQHVSYDLNGNLIKHVKLTQVTPAMAIGQIVNGLMMTPKGQIATNLTSASLSKFDGEYKGKNGIFAILDPDSGIAAAYNAAVKRDNWDIFIMADTATDRGFRLEYRKNMQGVNWTRKSDQLITRVVPVAKDAAGEDLYLPEVWIDSTHINDYPVIRMERLKVDGQIGKAKTEGGDATWTETDLLNEMRAKAGERFSIDKVDIVTEEVTMNFTMLGDTYEYRDLKGLESVLLYDTVTVTDETVGLSKALQVTELEWDAILRRITGMKLTNRKETARTVTGYNVQNASIGKGKLTDDAKEEIIENVKDMIPAFADPNASRPSSDVSSLKDLQNVFSISSGASANITLADKTIALVGCSSNVATALTVLFAMNSNIDQQAIKSHNSITITTSGLTATITNGGSYSIKVAVQYFMDLS